MHAKKKRKTEHQPKLAGRCWGVPCETILTAVRALELEVSVLRGVAESPTVYSVQLLRHGEEECSATLCLSGARYPGKGRKRGVVRGVHSDPAWEDENRQSIIQSRTRENLPSRPFATRISRRCKLLSSPILASNGHHDRISEQAKACNRN